MVKGKRNIHQNGGSMIVSLKHIFKDGINGIIQENFFVFDKYSRWNPVYNASTSRGKLTRFLKTISIEIFNLAELTYLLTHINDTMFE